MSRKEIKLQTKELMKFRWGIILLVICLVEAGTVIAGTITMGVGSILVIGPLLLSQYYILEDVRIGKAGNWKDILKGFNVGFAESFLAKLLLEIIMILPGLIGVIILIKVVASSFVSMIASFSMGSMDIGGGSGTLIGIGTILGVILDIAVFIVVIYLNSLYAETFYIIMREPGINAIQAMKKSRYMMKGHIGEYILFVLSFIGWFLLGIVTFCIGFIWIAPYYEMSKMVFLANIYENSTGCFNTASISDKTEAVDVTEATSVESEPVYNTCINCGAKLPDGAKFCGKCGTQQ